MPQPEPDCGTRAAVADASNEEVAGLNWAVADLDHDGRKELVLTSVLCREIRGGNPGNAAKPRNVVEYPETRLFVLGADLREKARLDLTR